MTNWQPQRIKNLRLRLGWSAAELSRRLGCTMDLIENWEKGITSPSPDDKVQLVHLEFHVTSYSETIQQGSSADAYFANTPFEQIHNSQLNLHPLSNSSAHFNPQPTDKKEQ